MEKAQMQAHERIETKDKATWFEVEGHPDVCYIELNAPHIDGGSAIAEMTEMQLFEFIRQLQYIYQRM